VVARALVGSMGGTGAVARSQERAEVKLGTGGSNGAGGRAREMARRRRARRTRLAALNRRLPASI
jgi:hypothetical protein